MSVKAGTILITLDLDGDKFTAKVSGATADLQNLNNVVSGFGRNLQNNERHVVSWGRRFRDAVIVIGLARHALLNFNDLILGLPRNILRANAELERMTMLMTGLGGETGAYNDIIEKSKQSVDFIFDLARTAPFEVQSITDSFVKLSASGIDPTNGSLQALIDSVAKFGGASEHLKRASIAIQQMSGKGVISMEELRQQLGEAVPNAVILMARALDVSVGDLVKKISSGTVEAQNALAAMFRQMEIENGGAALRMSTTWDGVMNRMRTRFVTLSKEVGDAGFFDEAKTSLREFTDVFLTSADAVNIARDLGLALAQLTRFARDSIEWLMAHRQGIELIVETYIKYKIAALAFSAGTKAIGASMIATAAITKYFSAAITRFKLEMALANQIMVVGMGTSKAAAAATGAYHGATAAASIGVKTLTGSVSGLISRVGMSNIVVGGAIVTLWALYEIWSRLAKKGKELNEVLEDFDPEYATASQVSEIEQKLAASSERIQKIEEARRRLAEGDAGREGSGQRAMIEEQAEWEVDLFQLKTEQVEAMEKLHLTRMANLRRDANKSVQDALVQLSNNTVSIQADYVKRLTEARERIMNDASLTQEERQKLITEERLGLNNEVIDKTIALIEETIGLYYQKAREAIASGADETTIASFGEIEDQLRQEIDRLNNMREQVGGLVEIRGSDIKDTPLQTWLESIENKIATVGAKVQEVSPDFEKFMTMLENDEFGDLSAEERLAAIEEARRLTADLLRLQNIYDASKESERVLNRERKNTMEVQAALTKKQLELLNDNPYLQAETDVEGFKTQLENTIETLTEAQNAIIAAGGAARVDLAEGIAAAREELTRLDGIRASGPIALMRREAEAIADKLLTDKQRIQEVYERHREYLREVLEKNKDVWNTEDLEVFSDYLSALDAQFQRDMETPFRRLVREWSTNVDQMSEVWATAMERFTSDLADALVEGKANFASFAKDILKMILKIQLQKMIAGIATWGLEKFDALRGSGASVDSAASSVASQNVPSPVYFAEGGIMTSMGEAILRRYSRGGVRYAPQQVVFGEGDSPEAYVPLPDGRSIPVRLEQPVGDQAAPVTHFNVINQTRVPVQVSDSRQRWDGNRFVTDVFLSEISKPGQFREAVKGALNNA